MKILGKAKSGGDLIQVSLDDLEIYFSHRSGDHLIYQCPFCPEKGHEGRGWKLYFSESKGIGYCFVCGTVITTGSGLDIDTEAKRFSRQVKAGDKESLKSACFTLNDWTVPAMKSAVAARYLTEGRKREISTSWIEGRNLRAASIGGADVLIFPDDWVDGETDFFQYRNLSDPTPARKYITVGYPSLQWLRSAADKEMLVLVEGPFDANAIWSAFGDSVGVACLCGSFISQRQKLRLRGFCLTASILKSVVVCVDGDVPAERAKELATEIASVTGGAVVQIAYLPDRSDPDDICAADPKALVKLVSESVPFSL